MGHRDTDTVLALYWLSRDSSPELVMKGKAAIPSLDTPSIVGNRSELIDRSVW